MVFLPFQNMQKVSVLPRLYTDHNHCAPSGRKHFVFTSECCTP